MSKKLLSSLLLATLLASSSFILPAADDNAGATPDSDLTDVQKQQKKESDEAAQEMKTAADKNQNIYVTVSGKLTLLAAPDPQRPDVVGTFETKDHSYLLKLGNDKLKAKLTPYDGKEVALLGIPTNKSKYLIVTEVVTNTGSPPTPSHHKRGGL